MDGVYGRQTENAIRAFQRMVLADPFPDGIIPVSGAVLDRLSDPDHIKKHVKPKSAKRTASNISAFISSAQLQAAANALHCEVAVIQAIASNEAPRGPFDEQGRPNILFEHHWFQTYTNGVWDKSHPDISRPGTSDYGPYRKQYDRLTEAEHLDSTSARLSTSWGAFQIMGFNYSHCGPQYKTVDDFVKGMQSGFQAQLDAFVAYIQYDPVLLKAVQKKDWRTFALHYNGNVGNKKHPKVRDEYDTRLANAYAQIVSQAPATPSPVPPALP